jgi:hypothetical protein
VICDRCQHEVSGHILTTRSWHRFVLCPDTSLGPRWDKCLNFIGGYVEVWCIPSASHVPFMHLSYNKVLSISVRYLSFETSLYIVIYAGTYLLVGCECAAYLLLLSKQSSLMYVAEVNWHYVTQFWLCYSYGKFWSEFSVVQLPVNCHH